MAMSPSVAASRAARKKKQDIQSAITVAVSFGVFLLISWFEWIALDSYSWPARLLIIVGCWAAGAATVLGLFYRLLYRGR